MPPDANKLHRIAALVAAATVSWHCPGERYQIPEGVLHVTVCETQAGHGWAVNYPKQRKLFFMADRLWLLYSDGANIVARTSADGATWSAPLEIRGGWTGVYGHRLGAWFDGEHLHYAFNDALPGEPVFYRRGTPEPDGTVTWTGPEQVAYATDPQKSVMYPKVIVDTLGRPWVAFMLYDGGVETAPYDAMVTMSESTDGTWITAPGFPALLVDDNTSTYPDPVGAPLTGGKTFWVYNKNRKDDVFYGRLWNGTAWEPEESVTKHSDTYGMFNLVAEGDDVHLVAGSGDVYYRKRTWGQGWGGDKRLTRYGSGHTSITLTGPDQVLVTWLNKEDHLVLLREKTPEGWGPKQLWADESEARLADTRNGINSNALVTSSPLFRAAVVYTTGRQAPFAVKLATLPAEAP